MATRSLTTVDTFKGLIAHLPLVEVERNRFGGLALMATLPVEDRVGLDHLYHALEIIARKRGLKPRRGIVVWTVNGFAQ